MQPVAVPVTVAREHARDLADLYRLKKEDVLELEGFAEKKAENLIQSIQASRTRTLERLINGLGIRSVGEVLAGGFEITTGQGFPPNGDAADAFAGVVLDAFGEAPRFVREGVDGEA